MKLLLHTKSPHTEWLTNHTHLASKCQLVMLWVRRSGRALWGKLSLLPGVSAGWLEDHNGLTHVSELSAGAATSGLGSSSPWPLPLHMTSRPPGPPLLLDSVDFSIWIPRRQKPRFTMAGSGPFPEGLLSLVWGAAWHQEFQSLQVLLLESGQG